MQGTENGRQVICPLFLPIPQHPLSVTVNPAKIEKGKELLLNSIYQPYFENSCKSSCMILPLFRSESTTLIF